ncbi:MAG: hypothetical protein K1060chlam5_01134 [Candidatus Anoxychlamydiales bacterium]|nr:hypothetical protein [Candidatus Anoxychlamydiales bacterium]
MNFELDLLSNQKKLDVFKQVAKNLVKKILPQNLFYDENSNQNRAKLFLNESLPIIKWIEEDTNTISIVLLCTHRRNVSNFFYDMASRYLLPQRNINLDVFFTSDFMFPKVSNLKYTIMQASLHLNEEDMKVLYENRKTFETEMRLGVVSDFHANRIREFKGLTNDRKTAMVQEKIGSLMLSKPKEYGRNIFSEMQKFLIMSRDEFKSERNYHHISRIISILYMIRKLIVNKIENIPNKRFVIIKFLKTKLKHSSKEKTVLGILVGLNFIKQNEVFEKNHLVKAISHFISDIVPIKNSYFIDKNSRNSIQTCYIEIEKSKGGAFSLEEISILKEDLPMYLKGNIEQLIHPIFMPRNEEEIVRNIMTLSHQLRYVHDIPQVIISFDKQINLELSFNIILLRVLRPNDRPLKDLILASNSKIRFIQDRVKKVGVIRRKYLKEANVYRAYLSSADYLRADHTIDINRARKDVLDELIKIFSDVRDYNGGMLLKQNEAYSALENSIENISKQQSTLLEKFFYSISPVEMTTVIQTAILKNLFLMLENAIKREEVRIKKREDFLFKKDDKTMYVIVPIYDLSKKKKLSDSIENLQLMSSEFISFNMINEDISYIGYAYLSGDKIKQTKLFNTIQEIIK